ncbi:hypothetical protein BD626DRAFT_501206 [Schizophyllum amplum]|uniref:Uncharacterized protein n=1 Tax=Schizophyllum amplum TaxID=97359 RepID=A0A550C9L0_9AGAR|nr:hypothetical protein BD626DRAFT_501206 [Auriculariopsis ampla]
MNQFIDYVNTPSLSNLRAVYTSMPRLLRLLKRSCCDLLHLWLACDSSSLSMGIEEIAELVVMAPNCVPDFHKFIEGVVDLLPPQPPSIYSIYHDPRTLAKPRALALEAFTWRCRELDDYSVQRMLDAMSWGASALQRNEVHLTTPLPPYIVQRIRDSDRPLDIYGLDSCVEMYKALPLRRPDYPFSERFEGPSMWI